MERNWILPHDLVVDVLSRLSVKDLLRLRCVCKEWCALIDDPSFIKKHYEVRYSICKVNNNIPYFIIESNLFTAEAVCLLSIHHGDAISLNLTADLERDKGGLSRGLDNFYLDCHGCVNGVVCLSFKYKKTPRIHNCFLALWNPATREFKAVKYPYVPGLLYARHFSILGFGFDLLSDDFKILGICDADEGNETVFHYEIYSLKNNCWKTIPGPNVLSLPWAISDGYLNGVYYMTTDNLQTCARPSNYEIVSFNFASEVFKVSDMPQDAVSLVFRSKIHQVTIELYKERLGLFISHEVAEVALCNIDVWVVTQLDDCGAPLSWKHLYMIDGTRDKLDLQVESVLVNDDILLSFIIPGEGEDRSYDDLMYSPTWYFGLYNHSRCEFKKFEINLARCFRYVESLFSIS